MSIEKIDQKKFFDLLAVEGYTTNIIFDLLESTNIDYGDIEHFNKVIRSIKETQGLKIFDMAVYLESSFSDYKKIIMLLDEQTNAILYDEVEQLYFIKQQKSKFEDL